MILVSAMRLNNSPVRCGEVPKPDVPKFNCPGFDFASAINSFTLLTPVDGCTTRMFGDEVAKVIGAKSLARLTRGLGCSKPLMMTATVPMNSV